MGSLAGSDLDSKNLHISAIVKSITDCEELVYEPEKSMGIWGNVNLER